MHRLVAEIAEIEVHKNDGYLLIFYNDGFNQMLLVICEMVVMARSLHYISKGWSSNNQRTTSEVEDKNSTNIDSVNASY